MELNVLSIVDRVQTEADAYVLLEDLRWAGRPVCPHCGDGNPYFLRPANGESRRTRTGSMSERRVWKCRGCRKQFSVLTGTIFHGTKVPLRTWLLVIFEMCANKNGVAAREVERKYNLTPKTAWFMLHRIREAMKRDPLAGLLAGTVISDETYYGGTPKNRHGHKSGEGGQGRTDKTPIATLVSKTTGEARSFVVQRVNGATMKAVLDGNIHPEATLHTDENHVYWQLGPAFANHESVNHRAGEYVRGDVTTNHAEGFFSQLKRSIDGTHHHVTVKHLPRYLAEFDYRYTTRKQSDSGRMASLMGQVGGKRLAYKPLRGE